MKTRTVYEILREMTINDLISCLADPCEDCDSTSCGKNTCGHYESDDGVQFGPAQVKKELEKRYDILKRVLKK